MTTNYKLVTTNSQRGAALLIAVLMASIMLSVGLGVYQRTYKELYFSSFWKQVQIAFAAADGGLGCALYWDLHQGDSGATNVQCFGISTWWNARLNAWAEFSVATSDGCVKVTITKNAVYPFTTIESRGYNDACGSTNPRRVERGLKIGY